MDANAAATLTTVMGWDGDVDGTVERSQQSPMNCGSTVAQHCAGTAGEDGCHPACLVTESVVTHRVHALMEAVETTSRGSLRNRGLRHSHLDELLRRDDPMLPPRDLRDPPIDWGAFVNHELTKAPRAAALPPYALKTASNSASCDSIPAQTPSQSSWTPGSAMR